MTSAEQFIALTVRNLKVIKAMAEALEAMQLVDLAAVEVVGGGRYRLDFARQIAGLQEALYLMGEDKDH